ncbi:class C sortase [Leucobacter salsicius]|uniref:class C sortase n=1 Tax=Leucobacter salsicius TaxID=664638 RepID=UPI00034D980D|nr:class C sortase [Leucobacter salsicius]
MNQMTIEPTAQSGASFGGGGDTSLKRTGIYTPILLQTLAMIGIGALLYSSAADWFSALGHNSEVSGYVNEVAQLPEETRLDSLRVAQEYNKHMPMGVLRDPYSSTGIDADLADDSAYQAYLDVLRVSDNGVIGEVSYPQLGISLPVYHGTSDEVLSRGVGHLYGSSLPIGGPSTHSVMTSHSGLINASLFTELPKAEIGDTFTVTVLGEKHHYEVRGLETVLPEQTESLRITDGEDWVTLITCTPIGVNSHRLLVQAERIPTPSGESGYAVAGDARRAGLPWWALIFLAGSAGSAYLIFAPPRRLAATPNSSHDHTTHQASGHPVTGTTGEARS